MAAAIALAIVLAVAVAGMSLAMQTQRPTPGAPSSPRGPRTTPVTPRRVRERRSPPPPPPPPPMPADGPPVDSSPKVPELLRNGVPAKAKVVNVVDERVVGPVTRSRLTLQIEPDTGKAFEVSVRHAFPTAEERGKVRVGGTVAVRYDRDDHHKVVLDPTADAAGKESPEPGPPTVGGEPGADG